MKNLICSALATLLAASAAQAQQAVQWRVQDGGNGHWYGRLTGSFPFNHAVLNAGARSVGAHLVSYSSSDEEQFVIAALGVGLVGLQSEAGESGFRWASGEVLGYSNWGSANCFSGPYPNNSSNQARFVLQSHPECLGSQGLNNAWDDYPPSQLAAAVTDPHIEWSADCNGDGIVDYGQCRDGTLPDTNGNNIPDCCEGESPCAPNIIVNGGFEIGASQADCSWVTHATAGSFVPGWSVVAASIDRLRISNSCPPVTESWRSFEGEFTIDLDGDTHGGAISQTVATESGSTYRLTFQLTGNCGAPGVKRMRVEIGSSQYPFEHSCSGTNPQPWSEKSIEFMAASSTTNIVFRSLSTSGRNGAVIDLVRLIRRDPRQPTCRNADLLADRNVNGTDLGILLAQWGPNTQYTISDINSDGVVDGSDLGLLLSFWGPCPY